MCFDHTQVFFSLTNSSIIPLQPPTLCPFFVNNLLGLICAAHKLVGVMPSTASLWTYQGPCP